MDIILIIREFSILNTFFNLFFCNLDHIIYQNKIKINIKNSKSSDADFIA